MGMDFDYMAGKQALEEIEEILSGMEHGEREQMADDLVEFAQRMKGKYIGVKPVPKPNTRLETLKEIKLIFDIHSDFSTRCGGYRNLCRILEEEMRK